MNLPCIIFTGDNCEAITSAFRVAVNECNQMWVIDSGTVGVDYKCPPQLLLFDLKTDKLIYRYKFDRSLYKPDVSLFINVMVDVRSTGARGRCEDTMVYVADTTHPGLVVYNHKRKQAWRIENRFMYPDPDHALQTVAGESFTLMDGIFGMAIDKKNLYFHPFASVTEYSVPLHIINDSDLVKNHINEVHENIVALGRRMSACTASVIDSHNHLHCISLNPIRLISWDVNEPYENYLELYIRQVQYLQFVSGIKVVRNHFGAEELWMLSNKFQKTAAGTRDFNETNFYITKIPFGGVRLSESSDLKRNYFNFFRSLSLH